MSFELVGSRSRIFLMRDTDEELEVIHEFSNGGHHRLIGKNAVGYWVPYQSIAKLYVGNHEFWAVTDYFEEGGRIIQAS